MAHHDKEIVKRLFTSIVCPYLEYGNIIRYPQLKKDVNLIERVQRRATKLIPELKSMNYETRLRELNLPTLVYRRYRGNAVGYTSLIRRSDDPTQCLEDKIMVEWRVKLNL